MEKFEFEEIKNENVCPICGGTLEKSKYRALDDTFDIGKYTCIKCGKIFRRSFKEYML